MNSGPDDERRQSSEPTFADVMNGFSFDAGRSPRRRRWGRRRGADVELNDDLAADTDDAARPTPPPAQIPPGPPTGPIDIRSIQAEEVEQEVGASAVRPYAWTRGRTKASLELAIETLVSTSQRGRDQIGLLQVEHRAVAELCEQTRSVAEVAALLSLPLGVARVLLGDMAGLGVVTVHQTASSAGNVPDLALMERVLSGLRRL
ncbi:DUF742 domain-containing protein [Pseudonocardia sp.]|jgi:hypothetical protein|uniref:DUF742 domain-containing protein n=1 Tax=Pseudonocardia sp. TaxID=60912 RepID=UPI002D9BB1E4|nr:DUF742 domain-containing protein [Pseudonocardia sp.]